MDKPHVEKEFKMMLNKEEYSLLLKKYNFKSITQVNYYYEINSKENAIRIRQIDNDYIFTLKRKSKDGKLEYEFKINDNSLNDSRIIELFNKFNINTPVFIGTLTTVRNTLELTNGEICLDYNTYLDKEDYEIEYELYDYKIGNIEELKDFLLDNNISYIENKVSKLRRFREAKYENRNING